MSKRIRLILGVVLLAGIVWWTDWARVLDAFGRMDWSWWVAAMALYLGTQCVSSLRWKLLSEPMGFAGPFGRFFALYFIGMFFNLVLPTSVGGDVVRAWYLAKTPGSTEAGRGVAAFSSVLLDRLSGLMVLLCLACVAVWFCPAEVASWLPWSVWALAGAAFLGMVGLTVLSRVPSPLRLLPGINAKVTRVSDQLRSSIQVAFRRPKLVAVTTLLSVFIQASNVIVVWLMARGLGLEVSASYFAVVVPVVSLLTMLPMSLNGMGVREGTMVLLLGPVGVEGGLAVTLAFLWFLTMAVASLGGLPFYLTGGFDRPPAEGLSFEEVDHGPVGDRSDQGRERQSQTAA